MSHAAHLWLYFLVVSGVIALPGLDMAFVLASSLGGGRRGGLSAVAGIMAGGVCHMVLGALGVAIVLRWWPQLFNAMLLAGALYIGWIGWSLLRAGSGAGLALRPAARSPAVTFVRAVITSLLNPKAYVFMLAVFPQFIEAGTAPVWAQAGALGVITAATQAGIYGTVALASARASGWLGGNPRHAATAARVVGVVLMLSSLAVGMQGWRAT